MPGRTRSLRIAGRDRMWIGAHSVFIVGPLDLPGIDAVRAALHELAWIAPDHRLFRRPDHDYHQWRPVPGNELDSHCERMVTTLEDTVDAGGPERLLERQYAAHVDDLPFRFAIGRDTVALSLAHPLGDARLVLDTGAELLSAAAEGRPPLRLHRPSTRVPLARALGEYYGRKPGRILATLRTPRAVVPGPAAGVRSRPWQPDFAVVSGVLSRSTLAEMRKWKVRNASGVTRTMVVFAAARAAVEAAGIQPAAGGFYTVVDNRKFLPTGRQLDGNFTIGIYVEPTDSRDPVAVSAALEAATANGRPLATMSLLTGLAQVGRIAALTDQAPFPARPSLVLNHLGRLRGFEKLPWRGGASDTYYLSATTQRQPDFVTFQFAELSGCVHVTATFHASTFDRELVRTAVDLLCADPVALLRHPASVQ
ncbi:hypothetical protein [Candidatus Protofrankia californiensis]|uniref:hypothetical protein n=1 Tax=Candidatus Protofrankia californiensis TaxID=1839754 RepID=UPI0010417A0D|nr:hypothetical protein [Candidatus Protofrankia californiensis]